MTQEEAPVRIQDQPKLDQLLKELQRDEFGTLVDQEKTLSMDQCNINKKKLMQHFLFNQFNSGLTNLYKGVHNQLNQISLLNFNPQKILYQEEIQKICQERFFEINKIFSQMINEILSGFGFPTQEKIFEPFSGKKSLEAHSSSFNLLDVLELQMAFLQNKQREKLFQYYQNTMNVIGHITDQENRMRDMKDQLREEFGQLNSALNEQIEHDNKFFQTNYAHIDQSLEVNHTRAWNQKTLEESKEFFTENSFKGQKGGVFEKYLQSQLPLYNKRTELNQIYSLNQKHNYCMLSTGDKTYEYEPITFTKSVNYDRIKVNYYFHKNSEPVNKQNLVQYRSHLDFSKLWDRDMKDYIQRLIDQHNVDKQMSDHPAMAFETNLRQTHQKLIYSMDRKLFPQLIQISEESRVPVYLGMFTDVNNQDTFGRNKTEFFLMKNSYWNQHPDYKEDSQLVVKVYVDQGDSFKTLQKKIFEKYEQCLVDMAQTGDIINFNLFSKEQEQHFELQEARESQTTINPFYRFLRYIQTFVKNPLEVQEMGHLRRIMAITKEMNIEEVNEGMIDLYDETNFYRHYMYRHQMLRQIQSIPLEKMPLLSRIERGNQLLYLDFENINTGYGFFSQQNAHLATFRDINIPDPSMQITKTFFQMVHELCIYEPLNQDFVEDKIIFLLDDRCGEKNPQVYSRAMGAVKQKRMTIMYPKFCPINYVTGHFEQGYLWDGECTLSGPTEKVFGTQNLKFEQGKYSLDKNVKDYTGEELFVNKVTLEFIAQFTSKYDFQVENETFMTEKSHIEEVNQSYSERNSQVIQESNTEQEPVSKPGNVLGDLSAPTKGAPSKDSDTSQNIGQKLMSWNFGPSQKDQNDENLPQIAHQQMKKKK